MIKVAIVEDDMACANELKSFFSRYKIDVGCAMEAEHFSTADEFLEKFNAGDYEMIFLDIEMPGTNGMQAAKLIREKDSEVLLFFVTNLSQYALESYEVQAFNFMVKPIAYDNFVLKIERAVKMVSGEAGQKIIVTVRVADSDRFAEKVFTVSELKFVEVFNHQIVYHTTHGNYSVRDSSMKAACERFESYGFFMCDQSYLVNLKYVTTINKDDCLVGGETVKISRRRRAEFLAAVAEYISFGQIRK